MAQQQDKTQTIEITNFGGRLTRKLNGDLNSGFAKFVPSFGYDPFSKPDNLTWLEQPTSILSSTSAMMVAAKPRFSGNVQQIWSVDTAGTVYNIQPNSIGSSNNPNLDSSSVISSVSDTFNYGAAIDFYGAPEKVYVSSDTKITSMGTDGSSPTTVGNSSNYTATGHDLKQFAGKLRFGNGNTVGTIDANTNTVTSSIIGTGQGNLYSELNPALGVETIIHDLDLSRDGNQLLITASNITREPMKVVNNDTLNAASSDGFLYMWNGSDATVTASNTIPSYAVTALQTYLSGNLFFSNDSFGASLNDGTNKLLTLPNNKSPLPNAILINGNFVSWIAPELTADGTGLVASLYYWGSLDQENPPGLYRVMRYSSTLSGGFIYQCPINLLTNNKYTTLNNSSTAVSVFGYGKHYLSVWDLNSSTNNYRLLRFLITPTGSGTPQLGVYETQTQIFSKRITVKQIRVYTEPTASGNGFQIDYIGSNGNPVSGSTSTYSFAAGSDITLLQGALERIDFNPAVSNTYALGIRITNTGTTNMTIKKIEVDWQYSGK